MNFDDFLGKQRNSEPRVVLMMRIITLFIISLTLIAYVVTLIKNVNDEVPVIVTSEVPINSLAVPGNYNIKKFFFFFKKKNNLNNHLLLLTATIYI